MQGSIPECGWRLMSFVSAYVIVSNVASLKLYCLRPTHPLMAIKEIGGTICKKVAERRQCGLIVGMPKQGVFRFAREARLVFGAPPLIPQICNGLLRCVLTHRRCHMLSLPLGGSSRDTKKTPGADKDRYRGFIGSQTRIPG